ncbi:MAG: glycosyltransferase family 2 protein [Desulfobulbaceae bacterium]|nr:glycosyltransferase family 2 protein [Desulfobulbaceae bacterium]
MKNLSDYQPASSQDLPLVSIIVPACNEEQTIEEALRSLLDLDYENLELIVVNDRSIDDTGGVIRRIMGEHGRIKLHTVAELPEGWLGKCNAQHQGALMAQGEYLLFTDADIIMEKSTIRRAVAAMQRDGLDHLSLFFKNLAPGGLLNAMVLDFGGGLMVLFTPWKVSEPKSRSFMGVGAFNMVKRSVYQAIGGHESIKMHPIDDVMLGKKIKQNGYHQECLLGFDFVAVHWYETPLAMINGLMKNMFAVFRFRLAPAMMAVVLIFLINIMPLWGAVFAQGTAQQLFIASMVMHCLAFVQGGRAMGVVVGNFLYSLLTPYITIFIVLRATFVTLKNGGINWRGTHYPLEQLRKNEPILTWRDLLG